MSTQISSQKASDAFCEESDSRQGTIVFSRKNHSVLQGWVPPLCKLKETSRSIILGKVEKLKLKVLYLGESEK